MSILIYGAGNIGSIYAGLLADAGHDVSILALGERLDRIREHGVELEDSATGRHTTAWPNAVEELQPEDAYDLVIVALGKEHVSEVLPILAENRHTPAVMFMGNNAAGPGEMVDALGAERVLLGFPGAGGVPHGDRTRYVITSKREQSTTIGELDGTRSARIHETERVLRSAGFSVAICNEMDAWLKTHVAEILPTAGALYMAAGDPQRFARTSDAQVLLVRAIREGYRVLRALDVAITPSSHRVFRWLPEPILVSIMRRMVTSEAGAIKIGHAQAARREMALLADEFAVLAEASSVATPAMQRLMRYIDASVEPLAEGSAELPLKWRAAG